MSSDSKFDILVNKIFKFLPSSTKKMLKKHFEKKDLFKMSQLITSEMNKMTIVKNPGRQDFIIDNIYKYLTTNRMLKNNVKIVDIGGGDGTVLSGLRYKISQEYSTDKTDFVCIENPSEWTEIYKFDKLDITYQFPNNNPNWVVDEDNIEEIVDENENNDYIVANSVDIVFCMVSLHHMRDEKIHEMMKNINKMLKKNGKLFIKEHDVKNPEVNNSVIWEHHLYHMLDCGYNNQVMNVNEYLSTTIINAKSKLDWQLMLKENNFTLIDRKNRFLDGPLKYDVKNVTEMYWDVYVKN